MWWGGGGGGGRGDEDSPPRPPATAISPISEDLTSPIPIRGGRSEEDSPLSGSFSSSFGSPSSDLRELRNLRHQFDDQEQLLGQIRDALQSSAQKHQGPERMDYASRLAQMRQKGKGGEKRKSSTPIKAEPETSPPGAIGGGKKTRGAKMQILRKQLEETKARQEAEASSRKDLEEMVSNLQQEICKRDTMIASLQLSSVNSSVISSPFVMSPEAVSPNYSPGSITPPYRGQTEFREQLSAKDNKILELTEQVADLGRKVFDLEENLKEKDEIISARTQAVGLAAASVSAKGKNTLEQLEDTREQLKQLQEKWSGQEAAWRKEKEETKIEMDTMTNKIEMLTQDRTRLEQIQTELENKGKDLRQEIANLQQEAGELKSKSREERILLEARLEEVEEDKVKLEQELKEKENIHQARVNNLEALLKVEKEGETGEEAGRIYELEISLAEREEEKGNLQLRILELEETVAAEGRMKVQLSEAKESLRRCEDDLETQNRAISMLESEKLDLMEALGARDEMLTTRLEEIGRLNSQVEEGARARVSLEMRCLELEELRDRWEGDRLELMDNIEQEKEAAKEALKPLDELEVQYDELVKEHNKFKEEHALALEKSKLYDTDLLDKYNKIKELKVEIESLQKMMQEKNQQLAEYFPFIEEKDNTITKLRLDLEESQALVVEKNTEIQRLNSILQQSGEVANLLALQENFAEINQQLIDSQQVIEGKETYIKELIKTKEDLEVGVKGMAEEKDVLEKNLNAIIQGMQEQHQLEITDKTKECETLKEQINSLIESSKKEVNIEREKVAELEESINNLKQQLETKEDEHQETLRVAQTNVDEKNEKLGEILNELKEYKEKLEIMETSKEEFLVREDDLKKRVKILDNIRIEMDQKFKALESEKSGFEEKIVEMTQTVEHLNETIKDSEQKIKDLESNISLKDEDLNVLNEDMVSKYKIIEDLQTDVSSHSEEAAKLKEETEKLQTLVSTLKTQVSEEQQQCDKLRHDLDNKSTAFETLQTVVDVLKAESETSGEQTKEFAGMESRIQELQEELIKRNLLIEEFKAAQTTDRARNTELSDRVVLLEKESSELAAAAECVNVAKKELIEKSEECDSLREALNKRELELKTVEGELFDIKQNKAQAVPEVDEDMVRLQQEQIEMLRSQLKDKADLLEKSGSDEALRSRISELTDEVELRVQEVEDVKGLLRKAEMEKTTLEGKLSEVEQFRQELVKESNQHAQESGEKMRELKLQLDNAKEEVNQINVEKNELKAESERLIKSLQHLEQKYKSLSEQGPPETAALIAERDSFKEKNEKLKDMCKKYLAKLKQQEVLLKTNTEKLENPEEEKYKDQINSLRTEVSSLNEEVSRLNQTVSSYEEQIRSFESAFQDKCSEAEKWEHECSEREQTILSKDDVIRDLKQKLENVPEDITVPIPDDAAHQQTKNELAALKEKCKKLIVKVKQQDALLKKESAKIRAESTASEESLVEDRSKEIEEEISKRRRLEEQKSCAEAEAKAARADLESERKKVDEITAENEALRQKICENEVSGETVDALKFKLDSLLAEKTSLYETQVQLKDEIKNLKQEKQAEVAKVESLQAKVKSLHEKIIISQMQASPLLQAVEQQTGFAGFEEDDGWGSPEPVSSLPVASQPVEDDGLITPEPSPAMVQASSGSPAVQAAPVPASTSQRDEDNSDGWGGWDNQDKEGNQQEGDGWDDDWGAETDLPDPGEPLQEKVTSEVVVEREADIEDGWGDDTWGGFETTSGTRDLAANLRLSAEKDIPGAEDGEERSQLASPDTRPPTRDSTADTLALQCKVAEKEAQYESLQEELSSLKERFQDLEEELLQVQESKDESERKLKGVIKEKTVLENKNTELEEAETKLKKSVDELKQKIQDLDSVAGPQAATEVEAARIYELEALKAELASLNEISHKFTQLQEKHRLTEEQVDSLTNVNTVLEERVSYLDNLQESLETERDRLSLELSETRELNLRLETEVNQVNEELEKTLNSKTDLQEDLKQTKERRNSLGTRIAELETDLERVNSENREFKDKIEGLHAGQGQVDEISSLKESLAQTEQSLAEKSSALADTQLKLSQLEAESSSLHSQVETVRRSEEQISIENAEKSRQLAELHEQLQQLQIERDSVDEERRGLNKEVENLRALLSEMSMENETLERNLNVAENNVASHTATINQLQDEVDRLRGPAQAQVQQHPPPDVTNPVSHPDVARRGRQNPPDIMHGQNVGGDVLGAGQLDLVTDNAASWFDNFADVQGNDWSMNQPVQEYPNLDPHPEQPAQPDGQAPEDPVARNNDDLQRAMSELRSETEQLRQQLSDSEGRFGILEREKAVLQQSYAQLLSDFKDLYEKSTKYEGEIAQLEAANKQIVNHSTTIDLLRQEIADLTERNNDLMEKSSRTEELQAQPAASSNLASFFDAPAGSAVGFFDQSVTAHAQENTTGRVAELEALLETREKENWTLKQNLAEATSNLATVTEEVNTLEAVRFNLKEKDEKVFLLEETVQELNIKLESFQGAPPSQQLASFFDAPASQEKTDDQTETLRSLAKSVEEKNLELVRSQSELENFKFKVTELEDALAQKESATRDQEAENAKMKEEVANLAVKLTEGASQLESLKSEIEQRNQTIENLNREIVSLNASMEALRKDVSQETSPQEQYLPQVAQQPADQYFGSPAGDNVADQSAAGAAAGYFPDQPSVTSQFLNDASPNPADFFSQAAPSPGVQAPATSQLFEESGAASDYVLEGTLAPAHQLQTAAQFFESAVAPSQEGIQQLGDAAADQQATASQFFDTESSTGGQQSTASFFNTGEQKLFDPFSREHKSEEFPQEAAAAEQLDASQEVASYFGQGGEASGDPNDQAAEQANQTAVAAEEYSAANQDGAGGNNEAWYQQEINNYQTAIAQWQVWGQEKSEELAKLQESVISLTEAYNSTTEAYNSAVQKLNACKDSEDKAETNGKPDDKVNEVLKLLKLKDMELEELKETIDRLETEKGDLTEEMKETKDQLKELDSASEQMEAYKNTLDQLEETKVSFEKARVEEQRLRMELEKVTMELNTVKNNTMVESESLHQALNEKSAENVNLTQQNSSNLKRLQDLEASLAEERRMQEEAACEFDAMQQEVIQSREQISDLNKELDGMRTKCTENEVLIKELETLKEQAMTSSLKQSEDKIEEMSKQCEDSAKEECSQRVAELEAEMETYKQHLLDWNTWSESKTQEYNQLLEAYNAYVEAYNTMSTEYNSLKESSGNNTTVEPEAVEALNASIREKDAEITRLTAQLADKEGELAEKANQLSAKETELVAKTGELAKMSIKSHLGKLMVQKQAETVLPPTQKVLSVVKADEVTVAPEATSPPDAGSQQQDWSEPEGWGDDPTTEQVPDQVNQLELEISSLRQQIKSLESSKAEVESELNSSKLKSGKLLVKVKTLTKQIETLKKSGTGASGSDDLDKALEEEMNNQMEKARNEVKEIKKELENLRGEKQALENKLSTLESANEVMVDMKEQQDIEVEYLRTRNKEVKEQVEGLQWQLAEVEERARVDINDLKVALAAYKENEGQSEEGVLQENARLRQELSNNTAELATIQQTTDNLREELSVVAASLKTAREEIEVWRSQASEAKEEIESLKLHIDTLQSEKGGSEEYLEAMRLNESLNAEIASLKNLIEPLSGESSEQLREKIRREQQLVIQLEQDLQNRDIALQQAREELAELRGNSRERMRRESTDSRFSMDRDVFMDQDVVSENFRLKSDLNNTLMENRRLSSRIRSWEQELERAAVLDQDGLRAELSHAIKTLQIKDNKCEELTQENLRLLEERDTLQLRLSSMMRQMESAASSRAITPVPGGQPLPNIPIFDPQTQIKELHVKLEELRKLNYALDVELQRERDKRENLQTRVMEPRARQADQILDMSRPSDSPVKHL